MADHNDTQAKGTTSAANDDIANHKTINKDCTGKFMFQSENVNIDVIAQNNNFLLLDHDFIM